MEGNLVCCKAKAACQSEHSRKVEFQENFKGFSSAVHANNLIRCNAAVVLTVSGS